jgi:hypothetical protein
MNLPPHSPDLAPEKAVTSLVHSDTSRGLLAKKLFFRRVNRKLWPHGLRELKIRDTMWKK